MIGQALGRYRVLEKLGAGGMGVVYRAHDEQLDRDVALKVLSADAPAGESGRARLLREARLASKLNHPHICAIYEVGEAVPSIPAALTSSAQTDSPETTASRAVAFIAMELAEGQTLSARLAGGPLPVEQVLRYGQQLADALTHAHARRVIHRDFKCANVVITPDGRTKVLDFGLARQFTGEQLAEATTVAGPSLTAPGVVAGTLAYMAPEQLTGRPADERSDIWALGIVLYELAAGARPFQGHTGFELTSAILKEPPPPLPPAVSPALKAVIARCLKKDSDERYQRASDVQAALDAAQTGAAGAPAPGWRRLGARRWVLATAAGAAALLAVATVMSALNVGGLRTRFVQGATAPARVIRLAVLPLANLSGDAAEEYLSDGITQEMIALLGTLHPETLRVIAKTSVMRYKRSDKPIDEIARELRGVDYILEGGAQRESGRIRIAVELIKVADQTQLWADRYEREVSGIRTLESDVARNVARALALKLPPSGQARLAAATPVDPEVYDLCQRGFYYAERLTAADLDVAERHFSLALAKDPKSAAAHAGMATVWGCRQQMMLKAPREAGPKAKAAALTAAGLDPSLAKARSILGGVLAWTDWDWVGAEREYRRAIELDPSASSSRNGYSHVLMILQRPDEALRQIERSVELDALSPITLSFYAIDLLCAHRYDEAIAQARAVLRMQPDAPVANAALLMALHEKKAYDDAIATGAAIYGGPLYGWPDVAEALKKGYTDLGYAGAWRRAAEVEWANHRSEPGVAFDDAGNFAMAGEWTRTLGLLEQAYDERDPNLPYINCQPLWHPLRSDPRFQSVLRRMGLAR